MKKWGNPFPKGTINKTIKGFSAAAVPDVKSVSVSDGHHHPAEYRTDIERRKRAAHFAVGERFLGNPFVLSFVLFQEGTDQRISVVSMICG